MSFPVIDGVETAMMPPSGWQVNFEDPTTAEATIRDAYWIFGFEFAIATALLGQRMYTNSVLLRKFLLDDYMILLAWLLSIAAQSCVLRAYRRGLLGVHAWEMSLDRNNESTLLVLLTTLNYIPTTILSKLTLCSFYFRLSPSTLYRYSVCFTGFVCASSLIGIWFSVLFACKPIAAAWDLRIAAEAICINRPVVYITQAAFGCVTDLMLLVLPIPTVVELQMSIRQKVGLLGLFAIGSVTLITSIVRLVLLLPSLANPDQSWILAEGCLWVTVAPRVLGEKSIKNSRDQNSGSGNYGLRTFGGSNNPRRKFDTLVELEYGDNFNRSNLRADGLGNSDVHIYGGQPNRQSLDGNVAPETGSEEIILQTRTNTISLNG
ncbi:hypothetical protein DL766_004356 [Monosporascus sp. MC13-8B]|uniref:Rhodopsin domain-containing protein n=1 Tax=Monosporascus cannonballus TaxID=155416 RepID=A0ABY0HAW1_9PEZI|nr:hypothetical protein DL762_004850 [Monosporascus cannonballus]RYO93008.1 hypothetical protein DL763_004508 [Monosporascus cannonballus]RYP31486.1 hypothetical protein DL766_004356 [Monosporascus sp. MC13-8B]